MDDNCGVNGNFSEAEMHEILYREMMGDGINWVGDNYETADQRRQALMRKTEYLRGPRI
jgi:hypothetical protein